MNIPPVNSQNVPILNSTSNKRPLNPPPNAQNVTAFIQDSHILNRLPKRPCIETVPPQSRPPLNNIPTQRAGFSVETSQLNAQLKVIKSRLVALNLYTNQTVHAKIKFIVEANAPHSRKMIALGWILYHLDKNQNIPNTSLIQYFSREIESELSQMIPSEQTHFLLKILSNMILTDNLEVNKGGLYAIIQIFKDSKTNISRFFNPEHRKHILVIVHQLLKDESCTQLLEWKHDLHPEMVDFVRNDLKLNSTAPISWVDASRACLMTLLSDIQQQEHAPNSPLVAPLIFMMQNDLYTTLAYLIDGLRTSRVYFLKSEHILLQRRITESLARQTLNKETSPQSALLIMLLKHLDLRAANTTLSDVTSKKKNLIYAIVSQLEIELEKQNKKSNLFIQHFGSHLEQKIWFENVCESTTYIKDDTLCVGSNVDQFQVKGDTDTLESLEVAFEEACYLLGQKGDDYLPIRRISDFQSYLTEAVNEMSKQLKGIKTLQKSAITIINSKEFKLKLAQLCHDDICTYGSDKNKIALEIIDNADLLLFANEGGYNCEMLNQTLKNKCESLSFEANDSSSFLFMLKDALFNVKSTLPIDLVPSVLIKSKKHPFTLDLERSKLLLNNENSLTKIFSTIKETAVKFLEEPIPQTIKKNLILRLTENNEPLKKKFIEETSSPHLTYSTFSEIALKMGKEAEFDECQLHEYIDEEYNKVALSLLQLSTLVKTLSLTIPSNSPFYSECRNKIYDQFLYPYQISQVFTTICMDNQLPFLNAYTLEQKILKIVGLPFTFDIGDLNWPENDTEHQRLMIRFHLGKRTFEYFKRTSSKEVLRSRKEFSECTLTYNKN